MSIFNFGSTVAAPALGSQPTTGGFGGWSSTPLTTQPLSFSSAAPQTSTAPTPGSAFSFGGGLSETNSASTTAPPAFSFGGPPAATTSAPLNFAGGGITGISSTAQRTEAPAAVSSFSFGGGSVSSLATAPSTTTTQSQTPAIPVTTQASGFNFPSAAPTTVASNFTAPASSSITASTVPTSIPSGTPAGAAGASASSVNFRQLQEQINKWTIDVEEQERDFIEQATKVNYWDKTLMSNAEKISKLSDGMEKVKVEHTRLEHELDFVKNSQKDLEGLIESLETALPKLQAPNSERLRMYSLTENMDTDLQQMSEDLKEIIRHINESNKLVDRTDPVSQVLRILNEHTDSLQWIEDHSNGMKNVLEDVSQMHQFFRRDHERSLKLMFKYN